jgi:hypothetical protein
MTTRPPPAFAMTPNELTSDEQQAVEAGGTEIRRSVFPQPDAHSHVYQHPEERRWCIGDNSGRTYAPAALAGVPAGFEAGEPVIDRQADDVYVWVWQLRVPLASAHTL